MPEPECSNHHGDEHCTKADSILYCYNCSVTANNTSLVVFFLFTPLAPSLSMFTLTAAPFPTLASVVCVTLSFAHAFYIIKIWGEKHYPIEREHQLSLAYFITVRAREAMEDWHKPYSFFVFFLILDHQLQSGRSKWWPLTSHAKSGDVRPCLGWLTAHCLAVQRWLHLLFHGHVQCPLAGENPVRFTLKILLKLWGKRNFVKYTRFYHFKCYNIFLCYKLCTSSCQLSGDTLVYLKSNAEEHRFEGQGFGNRCSGCQFSTRTL